MAWKRLCAVSEVPENTLKAVSVGAFSVVVVNFGSGFRVLPPLCPHMEEPLAQSGVVAKCVLTCTKHLWAWDLATLRPQGETAKPLQEYVSRVSNGEVQADVQKEIVYEFADEDELDEDDFFNKS